MKRLLLSTALIFALSQISFASTSPLIDLISSPKVKSEQTKKNVKKDDCSVTRNGAATGFDCNGLEFNIRVSCTVSSANCADANDAANACAFSKAQLAAALIYDECN